MVRQIADSEEIQPAPMPLMQAALDLRPPQALLSDPEKPAPPVYKAAIRTSLWASTLDGVFATLFSNIAGGVLLNNFLVELGASPTEFGMLSSIPLLANLLQPLGAYLGERTTSRHSYCLWVYGPSRLIWLLLILGIGLASWGQLEPQRLVKWTLAIVFVTHFLGALGSASWLSWLAALVPRRLRGRYFGGRNSAASLTNLISVPLVGMAVSVWPGGSIEGYGAILGIGIMAGLISLAFQHWMVDVNPQVQHQAPEAAHPSPDTPAQIQDFSLLGGVLQDGNFLRFLLYFGVWMIGCNLSGPFFNLYMLDTLSLDVSWVTFYNSLLSGANLLMLMVWGRVTDRIGNRPILLTMGLLGAVFPLFWLGTGPDRLSTWLWFPLLHILAGGIWAAIDLGNNNLQLGVAPARNQASYFAIAAAVAGVCGALGTTAGGILAEQVNWGGLPGVFAFSSGVRLLALLPLVFVHEQRGQSLRQMMAVLFPTKG